MALAGFGTLVAAIWAGRWAKRAAHNHRAWVVLNDFALTRVETTSDAETGVRGLAFDYEWRVENIGAAPALNCISTVDIVTADSGADWEQLQSTGFHIEHKLRDNLAPADTRSGRWMSWIGFPDDMPKLGIFALVRISYRDGQTDAIRRTGYLYKIGGPSMIAGKVGNWTRDVLTHHRPEAIAVLSRVFVMT